MNFNWIIITLTFVLISIVKVSTKESLRSYNVDPKETSVSGLSAGAFFATQVQVAYSSTIKGAGIIAGGPFDCAGQMTYSSCMYLGNPSVSKSISNTNSWSGNSIDDKSHLAKQKVYMISGSLDLTVATSVMNQVYKYYVTDGGFIPASNVVYKNNLNSAHTFPTDFDATGNNACTSSSSPYISNCKFDGAGEILSHIYGKLNARNSGTLKGKLIEFDQAEFISSPTSNGMDNTGWVYVPSSCESGQLCRLHISFHGCQQYYKTIGDKYIKNTGLIQWADTNNIIVVFPQAIADNTNHQTKASGMLPNPNGCFDWVGWYGNDFDVKSGKQLTAVKKIIDRISKGFNPIAAPRDLKVTETTDDSVSLSWSLVEGASGYNIYRNGAKVNGQKLTRGAFTDSNLRPGTTYTYSVTSLSEADAESVHSNSVEVKTTGSSPYPEAPTGVTVSAATANSISLTWNAVKEAKSYNIYRDNKKVGSSNTPSFTDTGLTTSTKYLYQVSSVNEVGEGSKSAGVSGTTADADQCFTADNYSHVTAGRAHVSGGYAEANGSNERMGLYNTFYKSSLKKTGDNYYVVVDSC